MYYTGIDLHKFTSYLTTVDESGAIVKQADIKNVHNNFIQYFSDLGTDNITTVESNMTWYWLNDLPTFNTMFMGKALLQQKSLQWPRIVSPVA